MNWLLIIAYAILGLVGFCLVVTLGSVYIDNITARTKKLNYIRPQDKLTNGVSVLLMIDRIVDLKLQDMHDFHIMVEQPFKLLTMDTDIEQFAHQVREALRPEVLKDTSDLLITSDFIVDYIVTTSTTKMMNMYKETNAEIAQILAAKQQR